MLGSPPSLQREYTLCFSGDPALDLPELPEIDRDTASAAEIEAFDKIAADREVKLKAARDHGTWPVRAGQRATLFRFRQVGGSAVRWWFGESQRQRMSAVEDIELMFRLALVGIDNIEGVTVRHDKSGKFPLVSVATMDEIYASGAGPAAVLELGTVVAERAIGGVPPL